MILTCEVGILPRNQREQGTDYESWRCLLLEVPTGNQGFLDGLEVPGSVSPPSVVLVPNILPLLREEIV